MFRVTLAGYKGRTFPGVSGVQLSSPEVRDCVTAPFLRVTDVIAAISPLDHNPAFTAEISLLSVGAPAQPRSAPLDAFHTPHFPQPQLLYAQVQEVTLVGSK